MTLLISMVLAWAFLALSRWGRRNADKLVSPAMTPERRAREERRLRRGARSLLLLSFVCAGFGVLSAVVMFGG
ncbi:hypothetical protein [Nocardioides daejeonensis]|uniref:hypothetical protein n=1 Tax=Nocardioides daejeonensis TaxID=1046556 RepID=UPI000D74117C|nr:hypothetical protein [Nocardioides daejeonensis]